MVRNIIIIGSGPAGHTAAIYLARANLEPLMLEGTVSGEIVPGGLLTTTKTVENFPGFPDGVDGFELTERFREQSCRFGTEIRSEQAIRITKVNELFTVYTDKAVYETRAILIATGSTPNRLYVPGYDEFWHRGISTCAVCDGGLPAFRNVPIAVVGGGDSACEEALHLARTASCVYMVHRRNQLRASKIMQDRVLANPKIQPVWDSEIIEIQGSKHVETIILRNSQDGSVTSLGVRGVFVAIGHRPNSQFVADMVTLDPNGFIETTRTMETSCKGIWAAGDVQDPHYRQAITAAGSGCIAALEIERYLC